jgi:hypothetical protein
MNGILMALEPAATDATEAVDNVHDVAFRQAEA